MTARRFTIRLFAAPLAFIAASLPMPADASAVKNAGAINVALAGGNLVKATALAEEAVVAAPRDANARGVLGRAYLRDGRFLSAATVLADAVSLGDSSSRTLLALALAQIGNGQSREAVSTLDTARNIIPAADLGLALALAGETSRATTILGDAVRAGDQSDKLRANLAYAYALDGRWAEARNLVSLDLPADKVDARMTEWAKASGPEASRERVAILLGVVAKADAGLPARLALAPVAADAAKLAAAEPAPSKGPELAAAPAPVGALPPLAQAASMPEFHTPEFHTVAPLGAGVIKLAERVGVAAAKASDKVGAKAAAKPADVRRLVQLGAFVKEENAQRAKKHALLRDKSLAESDIVIAKAEVGGKTFWRVSVTGLDAAKAESKCLAIRKSGGACFARVDSASAGVLKMAATIAPKVLAMASARPGATAK